MIQRGWPFEPSPWLRLAHYTQACSWHRTYLEDTYRSSVPPTAGVYVICASTINLPLQGALMDNLYTAIYVGQATNLRSRFLDHARLRTPVRTALTTFKRLDYWYSTVDNDELNEVEQSLLDAFGPPVNERNVSAKIADPVPAGSLTRQPAKEEQP